LGINFDDSAIDGVEERPKERFGVSLAAFVSWKLVVVVDVLCSLVPSQFDFPRSENLRVPKRRWRSQRTPGFSGSARVFTDGPR